MIFVTSCLFLEFLIFDIDINESTLHQTKKMFGLSQIERICRQQIKCKNDTFFVFGRIENNIRKQC